MEVRIEYSQEQLDETVEFIAINNSAFLNERNYIRNFILDSMREIARDPERWMLGTMGYLLVGDREDEGIDNDESVIRFEIWVDPSLGKTTCTNREEIVL